ncbi:MAG: High-affinity zinc uptake system ATP-binding protein ZnuC [Firmicutes bacterium ADurb.Bin456]|nr:MAG: High-affinity zinc uptake system ATP-binding protein ZnuC [Firmicutes bacterium ADurb.Bin456]
MNAACPILELENVSFSYGCHPILEKINLSIRPGESVGVTGPNGSGKSTLLKLIVGLLKPSNGNIKLFGQPLKDFKDHGRLSYLPQKASFINNGFPSTVEEVVLAGRIARRGLFRFFNKEDRSIVHRALSEVDMDEHRHKPIGSLSGGQQQRVFIARALAGHPELLLLDEPTAGMDPENQARFYSLLKDLVTRKGLTLILVSHDLDVIPTVVDRQVCLDKYLCSCCHTKTDSPRGPNCGKRLWSA